MSALVFVGVATGAAVLCFATRRFRIVGGIVAAAGLLAALVAALAIRTGDRLEVAGGALVGTAYGRLFLVLGLGVLLGVLVIGRLGAWHRAAPAAVLGAAAALGLAVATPDHAPALVAAAAAALVGTLVILAHPVTPSRVRAMGREVRGAVLGLVAGLVAVSVVPADVPGTAAGPVAVGFALLAAAIAVGHRLAAFPLHARASRLVDTAPAVALPLLLAWIPAGWALVLLGWSDVAASPASGVLGLERLLLAALALATLVGGAIAALIADEVEKVVAYTIVADAGIVLLAFAALDPQAYVAIRAWLLVFVAAKAALVGVAIALRAAYGTGRLRELGGWARRSPALAIGLGALLVAAIGWPGSATWDARQRLLEPVLGGPALYIGFVATLGAAVAIARILSIGLGRASVAVVGGAGDRPVGFALPGPRARPDHEPVGEPVPSPGGEGSALPAAPVTRPDTVAPDVALSDSVAPDVGPATPDATPATPDAVRPPMPAADVPFEPAPAPVGATSALGPDTTDFAGAAAVERQPSSTDRFPEGPGAARASGRDDPGAASTTPGASPAGSGESTPTTGRAGGFGDPGGHAREETRPEVRSGRSVVRVGAVARRVAGPGRRATGAASRAELPLDRAELPLDRRPGSPVARRHRLQEARHRFDANRAPIRSLLALVLAATALLAAAGAFGIPEAAAETPPAAGTPPVAQP